MAKANAAPADDEDDDAEGMGGGESDSGDQEESGSDAGSDEDNVICTVVCIPDQPGQYKLIKGDEDDSGEGGAEDQGTVYKGEGPLLKAILETVRDYEAEKSGDGTAQDNMMAGYGEEPAEPQMQKYNED